MRVVMDQNADRYRHLKARPSSQHLARLNEGPFKMKFGVAVFGNGWRFPAQTTLWQHDAFVMAHAALRILHPLQQEPWSLRGNWGTLRRRCAFLHPRRWGAV